MRLTEKANLALAFIAFVLFVLNQWYALQTQHLELTGVAGATVLAGFLALGVIVQVAKIVEGHQTWWQVLFTIVQLGAHIYAELAIWTRTQITGQGIPAGLPLYIVGLYWLVGVSDIIAHNMKRELALFGKGYQTPDTKARDLEMQNALLAQKLEMIEKAKTTAEHKLDKIEEDRSRTYEKFCEEPGCQWSTGEKSTLAASELALRAHMARAHPRIQPTTGRAG